MLLTKIILTIKELRYKRLILMKALPPQSRLPTLSLTNYHKLIVKNAPKNFRAKSKLARIKLISKMLYACLMLLSRSK